MPDSISDHGSEQLNEAEVLAKFCNGTIVSVFKDGSPMMDIERWQINGEIEEGAITILSEAFSGVDDEKRYLQPRVKTVRVLSADSISLTTERSVYVLTILPDENTDGPKPETCRLLLALKRLFHLT